MSFFDCYPAHSVYFAIPAYVRFLTVLSFYIRPFFLALLAKLRPFFLALLAKLFPLTVPYFWPAARGRNSMRNRGNYFTTLPNHAPLPPPFPTPMPLLYQAPSFFHIYLILAIPSIPSPLSLYL